jgi:hypothetical protein
MERLLIKNITVGTGGTQSIAVTAAGANDDLLYPAYRLTGSPVLVADLTFAASGTPSLNMGITLFWEANADVVTNNKTITIFSKTVPTSWATKNFIATCVYDGSAWQVQLVCGGEEDGWIEAADLAADSVITSKILDLNVTTAKIAAGAVTNAKLAQMATATIKGNDSAGPDVPQDLTMSELRTLLAQKLVLLGDVTSPSTTSTAAGTISSTTTIANDAITTAKIADSNITNAKMADDSVTLTNLASTGELESLTTSSPTPNSTALTTLASLVIPTGAMDTAGDVLEIIAYGSTGATNHNKTLTLVLGTTVLATNTTTAAPNNLNWILEAKIFYTGAAAQKGYCKWSFTGVASEIDVFTGAETWLANTIYVKGQNGTAAVEQITLEGFVVINNKKNNN